MDGSFMYGDEEGRIGKLFSPRVIKFVLMERPKATAKKMANPAVTTATTPRKSWRNPKKLLRKALMGSPVS